MKVRLIKAPGRLEPFDDEAGEALRGIPIGTMVEVTLTRPRNERFHRLFWSLMQLVYENQEHYKSANDVCTAFKFAVGHYKIKRFKIDGQIVEHHEPLSISFSAMDEDSFSAFFEKVLVFMTTTVLPGLNKSALEREVYERVGMPQSLVGTNA